MRKYIRAYIAYIDRLLAENNPEEIKAVKREHLNQIAFMQHERLMHLIVTVLFSVLLFITVGILTYTNNITYCFLTVLLLTLLVPYIFHYYFLENGIQKMYRQYNEMLKNEKMPSECRTHSSVTKNE